jgi:hypothetical protein
MAETQKPDIHTCKYCIFLKDNFCNFHQISRTPDQRYCQVYVFNEEFTLEDSALIRPIPEPTITPIKAQTSPVFKKFGLMDSNLRPFLIWSLFQIPLWGMVFLSGNGMEIFTNYGDFFGGLFAFLLLFFIYIAVFIVRKGYNSIELMFDPYLTGASEVSRQFQKMFKSTNIYVQKRNGIINFLYNKNEKRFGVILGIIILITLIIYDLWLGRYGRIFGIYYMPPWSIIYQILIYIFVFLITFLVGTILYFVIGIIRSIRYLGQESDDYDIFQIIERINKVLKSDQKDYNAEFDITTYELFLSRTKIIGDLLYSVSIRTLLFCIVLSIFQTTSGIIYFQQVDPLTIIIDITFITISLLFFIIPQTTIHKILRQAKTGLISVYQEIAGQNNILFLNLCLERLSNEIHELKREIRSDLDEMEVLIGRVRELSTWSFDIKTLSKIIAAGLIPFIISILQTYLPLLLGG